MAKTLTIRLNMERWFLSGLLAMVAPVTMVAATDTSVTAWADDTIAVDAAAFRIAVAPTVLRCSPDWCTGGTNVSGATYSLLAVTAPDTPQAATSSVPVSVASVEGDVTYGGSGYVRFIMNASVAGEPIGDTLVSDVSFGVSGIAAAEISADSRTNSLQEVLDADGSANLSYSALWAPNAAGVTIGEVKLSGRGGVATVTNTIFTTAGVDAEGWAPLKRGSKGWRRLLYQIKDGSDDVLLEYLTDEFFRRGGIMVNFR